VFNTIQAKITCASVEFSNFVLISSVGNSMKEYIWKICEL